MIHALDTEEQAAPSEAIGTDLNRRVNPDRINISGEVVMSATSGYPEAQQHLIRWLYSYAKEQNWGWAELKEKSRLDSTTLYRVWHNKYRDPAGRAIGLDGVCEKIAVCKSLCEGRVALKKKGFVETKIWKQMDKVLHETRLMQIISLVFGESQIGKTECALEHTHRNNSGRTIYWRVPAIGGKTAFLQSLARACHVSSHVPNGQLLEHIHKCFDHSILLIVDEVHLIFELYQDQTILSCMEVLRELHDVRKCGMAMLGTNVFREEFFRGRHAKMLKQCYKRGIYTLQLPAMAPEGDLVAVAASYGLPAPKGDARELVMLVAKEHGLGKFILLLKKANQMAAKKDEKVKWEHFVLANTLIAKLAYWEEGK